MRKILIFVHKYLGLILGLLLSITGISGSLIVFDRELDEYLSPDTVAFQPIPTLSSLDLAFYNARVAVDNGTAPTRIVLARKPGAPHIIRFPNPKDGAGPIEVSINPGTSKVMAVRVWGEYPVTWVYKLHYSFLAGETGQYVVGALGVCMLFFCVSGVFIWWPRAGLQRAQLWRRAFSIKRGAGSFRFIYDLHKTVGIYLLPVYIVLAFSGIKLVFHDAVEHMVAAVSPLEEYPRPHSTIAGKAMTVDEVSQIAQSVFIDARMSRVYLPRSAQDPYIVTFIQPEGLWQVYNATSVWLDQYSGEVLDVWDSRNLAAGNTFLEWQFPLHNGDALGFGGRALVFITGFLPALLFGSGVYMWWRKRRLS